MWGVARKASKGLLPSPGKATQPYSKANGSLGPLLSLVGLGHRCVQSQAAFPTGCEGQSKPNRCGLVDWATRKIVLFIYAANTETNTGKKSQDSQQRGEL